MLSRQVLSLRALYPLLKEDSPDVIEGRQSEAKRSVLQTFKSGEATQKNSQTFGREQKVPMRLKCRVVPIRGDAWPALRCTAQEVPEINTETGRAKNRNRRSIPPSLSCLR